MQLRDEYDDAPLAYRVDFQSSNRSDRALPRIASLNNAREHFNKRIMTKTRKREEREGEKERLELAGTIVRRETAARSQHARQIYIATMSRNAQLSVAFDKTRRYFMAWSAGVVTFVDVELSLSSRIDVHGKGFFPESFR